MLNLHGIAFGYATQQPQLQQQKLQHQQMWSHIPLPLMLIRLDQPLPAPPDKYIHINICGPLNVYKQTNSPVPLPIPIPRPPTNYTEQSTVCDRMEQPRNNDDDDDDDLLIRFDAYLLLLQFGNHNNNKRIEINQNAQQPKNTHRSKLELPDKLVASTSSAM